MFGEPLALGGSAKRAIFAHERQLAASAAGWTQRRAEAVGLELNERQQEP